MQVDKIMHIELTEYTRYEAKTNNHVKCFIGVINNMINIQCYMVDNTCNQTNWKMVLSNYLKREHA